MPWLHRGSICSKYLLEVVVNTYLNFVTRLLSPLVASKLFGCLFLKVELVMLDSHDDELAVCL